MQPGRPPSRVGSSGRSGDLPPALSVVQCDAKEVESRTMASTKTGTLETSERDEVVSWRLGELLAAGYEREDALELALAPQVDLHVAIELPRCGCPHQTAVRILF